MNNIIITDKNSPTKGFRVITAFDDNGKRIKLFVLRKNYIKIIEIITDNSYKNALLNIGSISFNIRFLCNLKLNNNIIYKKY